MTTQCMNAIGLDWGMATDHSPDDGLTNPTGSTSFSLSYSALPLAVEFLIPYGEFEAGG